MISNALVTGVANLLLFGVLLSFRRWVHREGLRSFRWHCDLRGRCLFLQGALAGLLSFAAYPIVAVLSGQGQLQTNPGGLPLTIRGLLAWGLAFLFVALFEEALFRDYLLRKLSARLPQGAAIVLSSLSFGAFHAISYGSGGTAWLGIVNAGLLGVVLCLLVLRSGSLMAVIGWHWSWNLAQELLFLQPNGEGGPLFGLRMREGLWMGGNLIPETGLFVTGIALLLGAFVLLGWKRAPEAAEAGSRGSGSDERGGE